MKALTQKQRKQFADAADRVKSTNARSRRVPKLETKLQEAYALLQENLEAFEALTSADRSRDFYIIRIKNHAEPASGRSVTHIVMEHQAQKNRDFLGGK